MMMLHKLKNNQNYGGNRGGYQQSRGRGHNSRGCGRSNFDSKNLHTCQLCGEYNQVVIDC